MAIHGQEEEEDQEKTRKYNCDLGSPGAQTGSRSLQKLKIGPTEKESIFLSEVT